MSDRPDADRPPSDVYTILLMLSTILLAGSTIFLAMRSHQLFGSFNPFSGA